MTIMTYCLEKSLRQLCEEWIEGAQAAVRKLQRPGPQCQLWGGREVEGRYLDANTCPEDCAWHAPSDTPHRVGDQRRSGCWWLDVQPGLGEWVAVTGSWGGHLSWAEGHRRPVALGWGQGGANAGDPTSFFRFPNVYDIFPFLKGHC